VIDLLLACISGLRSWR